MSSTSNPQESKKPKPTPNWLDLPSDLMVNIFQRATAIEILEDVQTVCTTWHEICKDPALWRVIYLDRCAFRLSASECREMCKHVVDRSQGQLVDLTAVSFCDEEILHYVADRASQLKRLEIATYSYHGDTEAILSEPFKKLSLLEELSLFHTDVQVEFIEVVGRYCPLLRTLKLNQECWWDDEDRIALAIGKNLPQLTHLELIGSNMRNTGLQAILDGCCQLETLDLRRCEFTDLEGELGKRCSQQIKNLKLPDDSLEGCPHIDIDDGWGSMAARYGYPWYNDDFVYGGRLVGYVVDDDELSD